jgi:geranylgeranyl pyrophosphate synthase
VRHGDDGRVYLAPFGEEMFYYFFPRCSVAGSVTVDGAVLPVSSGSGWLDHEFGGRDPDAKEAPREGVAWNWLAAQLDDGSEVTAYEVVRVRDGQTLDQRAILVDAQGRAESLAEMELRPGRASWRSLRTFFDYPTSWTLRVPAADLRLEVEASFEDQELLTTLSKPAFWEGRCEVRGSVRGRPVKGLAYFERSGFEPVQDLDGFFSAVGGEVKKSVARLAPLEPTVPEARNLIASDERPHYLEGVDLSQLSRALIAPLRSITDRGGKAWRSYAALACCDVVGGDSRKFAGWLAMPELLHVGSLIVDDVQDKSEVRRGGPACHVLHGEPKAINAGTAAYFLSQHMLAHSDVSAPAKLRLYDLYFEAMRAGHAGQALDLDGLDGLVPAAVESGDARALESRILATHRLKTAAPAAALARMGAVAGGGSAAQIEAVGGFFEALGLAFQIVDDVLNLRGFRGNLKSRAEDLANGTVTLPVAKALSLLPREGRDRLWATLQARTRDPIVLSAAVEELETCGAIEACAAQARELVEAAWARSAPLLDDSLYKVMLRAFGWYVLERHY